MRTESRIEGAQTAFVVLDLDPAYHDALRDLYPEGDPFAQRYPTKTPHLDRIYANFARDAETMIDQTARTQPANWEQALDAFLRVVAPLDLDWWLCGSAALAVRGLDIAPRDIDLSVSDADAHRLGAALLDHLVEPVSPTPGWFCNWFGRAFLYARVEWVGGVDERADRPHVSDFGPTAATRAQTVTWHGFGLRVPPLELQLEVSHRRGLADRVTEIERALQSAR